jgi:hypothetical protein
MNFELDFRAHSEEFGKFIKKPLAEWSHLDDLHTICQNSTYIGIYPWFFKTIFSIILSLVGFLNLEIHLSDSGI